MTDNSAGLPRALTAGDYVILSTGAIATVRGDYPVGYSGDVAIMLDGAEELERVDGLTLPGKIAEPHDEDDPIAVIAPEASGEV